MTLANKVTLLRILCIPLFLILLLNQKFQPAALLLLLCVLTDALDGSIARYFKQKTPLGSFLDPLADKLLLLGTFGALTHMKVTAPWIFVMILSRDVLVLLGWIILYFLTGSITISPRMLGKVTIASQMFYALCLLLEMAFSVVPKSLLQLLLVLSMALTASSMLDYLWTGSRVLSRSGKA